MRALKEARGWPDAGFEEKAYGVLLQDERMAALDAQANDLLAKLDALGTVEPSARARLRQAPGADRGQPQGQRPVKAKAAYTLAKLDQMLACPADHRAGARAQEHGRRAAEGARASGPAQIGYTTAGKSELGDQDHGRAAEGRHRAHQPGLVRHAGRHLRIRCCPKRPGYLREPSR